MSEPDRQWAWWDNKRKQFRHIYPSKLCVQMCFPDYGKHLTAQGEGEIVEVEIRRVSTDTAKAGRECDG